MVLTSCTTTASPSTTVKGRAPDAQVEVLADGKVTYAEMESLEAQAVKCLKARGISIAQYIPNDNNRFDLQYATPPGWSDQQLDAVVQACQDEFLNDASLVYDAATPYVGKAREMFLLDCLSWAGQKVQDADGPEFQAALQTDAGQKCVKTADRTK